jgi:hypothetical protein
MAGETLVLVRVRSVLVVGMARWGLRVQGEVCMALHARCRAGWCAARGERTCARLRTRVPFSASRACTGGDRAQAGEGSTDGEGGGWPLGVDGGVLGVHWRGCGLWLAVHALVSNGVLSVSVGEREQVW